MKKDKNEIIVKIPLGTVGMKLASVLPVLGHSISMPCGGNGTCGKCRVKVLKGKLTDKNGVPLIPDENGTVPACKAYCSKECTHIAIRNPVGRGLELPTEDAGNDGPFGIALDIGTTTIAAAKVNLKTRKIAATASCLNPQAAFGADVISRITAASAGHLNELQSSVTKAVRELLEKLLPGFGSDAEAPPDMTVAGNATMLHLFAGISPEGMGRYPFTPAFRDARVIPGKELGLPVNGITLLPSISAFDGGDITAGMYSLEFGRSDAPKLLLDIGTNAEMVLDIGSEKRPAEGPGRLLATSAAAGPAFEGANISCGTGGVAGAVCSVRAIDGHLIYRTVGNAPANGICGSGLLDFTAFLLRSGLLEKDGRLRLFGAPAVLSGSHDTSPELRIYPQGGLAKPEAVPSVMLTQGDIRQIQLAKSAIYAGTETLLAAADYTPESFIAAGGRVFIAGGFGFYMNPENAAVIGMIPECFKYRTETVGNTALKGAVAALCDENALSIMKELSESASAINLEDYEVFAKGFIEHTVFPAT
ncbi:MAG: ASKHA domain-containing protein [Clostridia bacterium]|nr:ASKHA domain-containing protein [Clostridia bacterium]